MNENETPRNFSREWWLREKKAQLYQIVKYSAQIEEQRIELLSEIEKLEAEIKAERESQS
jgi:uncharacterized small protein (DUF1192 family)